MPLATSRSRKADAVCVGAVDLAHAAVLETVDPALVGEHLGHAVEAERVVTHLFACLQPGYRGWRWAVTVARASRAKSCTVDEVVLLPGEEALTAPEWVPWRERIQPGDLGPGDLLPPEEGDPRLVPGHLSDDEALDADDEDAVGNVSDEVGLGRSRVLSLEGREMAAERWYDGSNGPGAAIAESAPGTCSGCGFLVRLAGPLSGMFGVCANADANDDGRVVSLDHGCGAHSEAQLHKRHLPQPLPEPVVDTVSWDDLVAF